MKMNRRIILLLTLLFLFTGRESEANPLTEEPRIYRALLMHLRAEKTVSLVIRAESISGERVIEGFDQLKIETKEIKQSFIQNNSTPSLVPLSGKIFGQAVIISSRELEEIFKPSSLQQKWKNFYKKYPRSSGIMGLSRVGFNADTTKAVVYFENVCGKLCGNGYIAYLEKGWLGWKVERVAHLWIS